jgi:hypothetical protein
MKYLVAVLCVVIVVIAAVVMVGWALPARHRAVREAAVHGTPSALYALITDVQSYPSWRTGVTRVELLPDVDGHRSFREIGRDGSIPYVVEVSDPGRRIVTRIADRHLPFGGTWTYELLPAGQTTTLRITEDGEVYNPVFRFVSRFIIGHTVTIDRYLRDVEAKLGATPPDIRR